MNARKGLERISAVWWGLWGFLAAATLVGTMFSNSADRMLLAGIGTVGIIATYGAHRLTCWILDGFFSPRD